VETVGHTISAWWLGSRDGFKPENKDIVMDTEVYSSILEDKLQNPLQWDLSQDLLKQVKAPARKIWYDDDELWLRICSFYCNGCEQKPSTSTIKEAEEYPVLPSLLRMLHASITV
jgi:hypothetical protein